MAASYPPAGNPVAHPAAPPQDYLDACLELPFFDPPHAALAREAHRWGDSSLPGVVAGAPDLDARCIALVGALGKAGLLRYCVPRAWGGALEHLDSRSICLLRESLGYHDALADFAFAMQGLGSGAIALGGSDDLRRRYLPKVASGEWLAAFALSEPQAGSDVAAMTTRARRDGDDWVIDGCKTWISNGGIASFYTVFARTSEDPGPAWNQCLRGRLGLSRPQDRRAHRRHRAPPARHAGIRRLPDSGRPDAGQARGRVQARDGDPRHLSGVCRRGRAGHGPPRSGRGPRLCQATTRCSGRRWRTSR